MPSFEQHCRESAELFGKRYEEVHRFLHEFAGAAGIFATGITSSPAPRGPSVHIVLQYGEMPQTIADFSREKREIAERMNVLYGELDRSTDVDMLWYTPRELDRMQRTSSFVRHALGEGVVMYERSESG